MNQMRKPAEKYRQGETIDLNNVLSGYAIKKTQTQTEYDMTFNLAEIVDNKVLGNLTLHTYIGEAGNGESYLQEMALQVSVHLKQTELIIKTNSLKLWIMARISTQICKSFMTMKQDINLPMTPIWKEQLAANGQLQVKSFAHLIS